VRFAVALSRANASLSHLANYLRTHKKRRLYRQWVQKASLPPEAVPRGEAPQDITPRINWQQLRQNLLFMLLGAVLTIFAGALVLLLGRC